MTEQEKSAAGKGGLLAWRQVPVARPDSTCGDALALIRQRIFEYADAIVITDVDDRVMGVLSAGELAMQDPRIALHQVMHRNIQLAHPESDQERVASLAIDSALGVVAIVDANERLLGLVPPQAILAILRREHIEDLHRLTGILHDTREARAAIEGPPIARARHRLPWLFVGLAGSAVAAIVMARFTDVLQSRIEIAYFLPGIVYLADAIGTQTEAIAVRGLSLSHFGIRQLLARELGTGLMMGALLGSVSALCSATICMRAARQPGCELGDRDPRMMQVLIDADKVQVAG